MTRLAITSGRYVRSIGLALMLAALIASASALTETAEAASPLDIMAGQEAQCKMLGGIYYEVNMRDYGCWYVDATWNCHIGWNYGGWYESCIIIIHEPDGPVYHAP